MSPINVAVVIVNWHSEKLLAQVLVALNEQTLTPDRIIVVDNGSSEPIPIELFDKGPAAVITMNKNVGFAAANNRAIEELKTSEWIALLNPDAIPDRNWLMKLAEAIQSHPEASAFGSRQLMSDDHSRVDGLGDKYHVSGAAWRAFHGQADTFPATGTQEIFSPCAAAAIYKRSALLEAGGFDEDFFCYFEDVDLGFRLRLLGHKLMLASEAIVYHAGGGTSGGYQSDFSIYHGQRNLVWAFVKNMPSPFLFYYFFEHMVFNLVSIVYFGIKGKGRAVLKAKWHALLGLPGILKKRRVVQRRLKVSRTQVRALMERNSLSPYRRGIAH